MFASWTTTFRPHSWLLLLQSFAWSSCSEWSVGLRVPFVVDVCPMTFEQLDLLLRQVSEGMDGSSDWPPPQEKECVVVATLNLLRLQVGDRLPRSGPELVWSVHFNLNHGLIGVLLLSCTPPSATRLTRRSWDWASAACSSTI